MSDTQEKLIQALIDAQHDAARDYVKRLTSFTIGLPEGSDKLHVMLIDTQTKEVIKKINCVRFFLSNISDDLTYTCQAVIEKQRSGDT